MTIRHLAATVPKNEPVSADSLDQKEGSLMRIMRIRSWLLGICVALYVNALASPAMASAPNEIVKQCPDAAITAGPDQFLGWFWGIGEYIGVFIAIAAFVALICVAAIPKLRGRATSTLVITLFGVLFVGTFIQVMTSLPGTTC